MIELEKTYLIKKIPKGYKKSPKKEIIDIYFPKTAKHPNLRLRKSGDKYEMTKKTPIDGDSSRQLEQTIPLTKEEFAALSKVAGKKVHKIRYYYPHAGRTAELDVFQGDLKGLVVVDFEFEAVEEKDVFQMPDFCLADITTEEFIAGGMICGKRYSQISKELGRFGYKRQ